MPSLPAEFHAFTLLHGIVVLAATAAIAASCYHGHTHRETPREARFRITWAWFVLATQALSITYWALPSRFDIQVSLPLHVCDLAGIIAGLAMLTMKRPLRTLLYFWGIALSTQAFITPTLDEGPGSLRFWIFWMTHLQIVGSAIYDLIVGGYRPFHRDYWVGVGITTGYAAMAILVNLVLDTNYGYLGNRLPGAGTALNYLPPWPWRLLAMCVTAFVWLTLFYLIWPLARRFQKSTVGSERCTQCQHDRTGLPGGAACPECGAEPPRYR